MESPDTEQLLEQGHPNLGKEGEEPEMPGPGVPAKRSQTFLPTSLAGEGKRHVFQALLLGLPQGRLRPKTKSQDDSLATSELEQGWHRRAKHSSPSAPRAGLPPPAAKSLILPSSVCPAGSSSTKGLLQATTAPCPARGPR